MAERDSDLGSFITGFFIGGLVGAAVALLFAPQSGEETRTMIRDKGIELRDQATEKSTELRARAEQLARDARTRAEELQRQGQVILEDQRARLEDAVEAGKKAVRRRKPGEGDEPAEA